MKKTFLKASLTANLAHQIIEAATQKAEEINTPMVIAIVDESGSLKAFRRMDGAKLLSVEIAQNKAWSAAAYGLPTDQWFEFIKNDPPLQTGIVHTPRLVVYGGGFPVVVDEQVVGGIGVSGGHYSQDMECAKAGLRAVQM